jgi:hypothetical protein
MIEAFQNHLLNLNPPRGVIYPSLRWHGKGVHKIFFPHEPLNLVESGSIWSNWVERFILVTEETLPPGTRPNTEDTDEVIIEGTRGRGYTSSSLRGPKDFKFEIGDFQTEVFGRTGALPNVHARGERSPSPIAIACRS